MKDKFLRLLGLSRKAGKLVIGANKTIESVKSKKAFAVFFAKDISQKTQKEINFHTKDSGITSHITPYDIETISNAIGIKAGVVAVQDEGFSNALISEL